MSFPVIRPSFHLLQGYHQLFCIYIRNYGLFGEPTLFVQLTGDVVIRNFSRRDIYRPFISTYNQNSNVKQYPEWRVVSVQLCSIVAFPYFFFFLPLSGYCLKLGSERKKGMWLTLTTSFAVRDLSNCSNPLTGKLPLLFPFSSTPR